MIAVPEVDGMAAMIGESKYLPKRAELPKEFREDWHHNPFCNAVSSWFFKGCEANGGSLVIEGKTYTPKEGVNGRLAIRAIGAALKSFEPSHEHKIGACGYLLSEWFTVA